MARVSRRGTATLPADQAKEKVYSVGLYARLSVEDIRKKESESIENQIYLLKKYIEDKPYLNLFSIYVDNGQTGTNFKRDEFQRLMSDIKVGKVNCIIVKDLSRFGRNYIEAGNYLEKIFPFLGIRFISINDGYDSLHSKNGDESLILPLKNIINDIYAKDISKKIITQFRIKQKKGEYLGTFAPYGYLKSEDDRHKLVIDQETAPIVQNIFQWILEGVSDNAIAVKLNELGIPSPNKYRYDKGILKNSRYSNIQFWHKSAIPRIASNLAYIGHMVQGKQKSSLIETNKERIDIEADKWIIVRNTHPAIIDEEVFMEVQRLRSVRKEQYETLLGKYDSVGKSENILKGLIICGDCKRNLIRHKVIKANNRLTYCFLCQTYESGYRNMCKKKSIYEEDVLSAINESIMNQIELLTNMEKVIKKLTVDRKKDSYIKGEIVALKKRLSKITSLRSSIYEDYVEKTLSENEYLFIKKKYDDEKKAIQEKLDLLLLEEAKCNGVVISDNKWSVAFNKFKNEKIITREMITELINKVEVYSDKSIKIIFNFMDEYEKLCSYINNMKEGELL